MASKRSAAAKKAARTRKRNTAKRRAAGKKAAQTRKRRGGTKRRRTTPKAKRRAGVGGGSFGNGVASGAGFAIGGGLIALIGALLLWPFQGKKEEEEPAAVATSAALDGQSIGLSGTDLVVYTSAIDNTATYQETRMCN